MIKNKSQLKKLEKIDNLTLKAVNNALNSVIYNRIPQNELEQIRKIKYLRNELRISLKEVEFEDYGSGSKINSISDEKAEDKIIIKKTISQICLSTVTFKWGSFIFKLIREFKPTISLELGTCIGISALYQAMAFNLNEKGKLYTIEGAPSLANIAEENFKSLDLNRVIGKIGKFSDVLPDLLPKIKPIGFAFIDGHHDEKATLNYFEQIYPSLSENAILLFDDINWSKGMKRAWKTLKSDERINFSIDLWSMGICVISNSKEEKHHFKILLE